jgi:hypothetical protein
MKYGKYHEKDAKDDENTGVIFPLLYIQQNLFETLWHSILLNDLVHNFPGNPIYLLFCPVLKNKAVVIIVDNGCKESI